VAPGQERPGDTGTLVSWIYCATPCGCSIGGPLLQWKALNVAVPNAARAVKAHAHEALYGVAARVRRRASEGRQADGEAGEQHQSISPIPSRLDHPASRANVIGAY
jgi:hypothetical protein